MENHKLEILREIRHVISSVTKDEERDRLVAELWKQYEAASPVLRMGAVNIDKLIEKPKWFSW